MIPMSHCELIQFLQHVRGYIWRHYGGTEGSLIVTNILKIVNPEPYWCGLCDQRHAG